MQVSVYQVVEDAAAEASWRLYEDAFAELRATAVQRHVMTRAEFDAVLADKRVAKYVARDPRRGGRRCGIATVTNQLDAMPLISPEYFAARWPQRYLEGRIYYIGFVAVDPDYHGTGVFAEIVEAITRVVAEAGGVAALDICRRNERVFQLPRAIIRLVDTFADGVRTHRMDEQTFWAYEFPSPS